MYGQWGERLIVCTLTGRPHKVSAKAANKFCSFGPHLVCKEHTAHCKVSKSFRWGQGKLVIQTETETFRVNYLRTSDDAFPDTVVALNNPSIDEAVEEAIAKAPEDAYAFWFCQEDGTKRAGSNRHYIGARLLTPKQVPNLPGDHSRFLSSFEATACRQVVLDRFDRLTLYNEERHVVH